MPRFVSDRDVELFRQISKELVETAVETLVVIYTLSPDYSKTNIYGESLAKVYYPGVQMAALIEHDDQQTEYQGAGPDVKQAVRFRFQRDRLQEKNLYPQSGDIVDWNDAYYEITESPVENQLPGGRIYKNFSFVCEAVMIKRSDLHIEERQR